MPTMQVTLTFSAPYLPNHPDIRSFTGTLLDVALAYAAAEFEGFQIFAQQACTEPELGPPMTELAEAFAQLTADQMFGLIQARRKPYPGGARNARH